MILSIRHMLLFGRGASGARGGGGGEGRGGFEFCCRACPARHVTLKALGVERWKKNKNAASRGGAGVGGGGGGGENDKSACKATHEDKRREKATSSR